MPQPNLLFDPDFPEQLRSEFGPENQALIGVSGGRDSMALLHILHAAGFEKLVVCHLNHGARAESCDDEEFVEKQAEALKLPFVAEVADVPSMAREKGISFELAARLARHEFFGRTATRFDCDSAFLAHHADDQVETVLMNLFRGTGIRGLGGMKRKSCHSVNERELNFCRPLLGIRREEIDQYCKEKGIEFREDASNADLKLSLRNRIRHQLVPDLAEMFGRDTRDPVLRLARIMQREEVSRQIQVDALYPALLKENEELSVTGLRELTEGDQYRVVEKWLDEQNVGDVGLVEIERVLELLDSSGNPAKVNLPGNVHARRRAGRIFLERDDKSRTGINQ